MRTLLIAMLLAIAAAAAAKFSCAGPIVHGECSPDGLDEALDDACTRWPETCEVGQRMDFICVDAAEIVDVSRCGGWYGDVQACTMWMGSPMVRGRVFVRDDVSVADAARHEAQHWHLLHDDDKNNCQTHTADCGWIKD